MKFIVIARSVSYYSAEIEADDFDSAKELYEEMDGGEFVEDSAFAHWELDSIECKDTGETIEYN